MDDEVARRKIRPRLELAAAGGPDAAGLFLPAGDLRCELPLRQNGQTQLRVLAPRRECPDGDLHGVLPRIVRAREVERRRDLPLLQQAQEVARTHLAAAEHQHAVPARQIVDKIRCRRVETAAVGRELLGRDLQQRPRREQIPARRQALHLTEGEGAELRRQLALAQCQLRELAREPAVFERGGGVLLQLPQKALQALGDAAGLPRDHNRLRREIVRRRNFLRIDRREHAVAPGRHNVPVQALGVAAERLHERVRAALFLELRGDALELFRRARVAEGGQHLRRGQQERPLEVAAAPLGVQLELTERVDLVVEEFAAHGLLHPRREHIEDAAAHGELAGTFHPVAAGIARVRQLPGERRRVVPAAHLERQCGALKHLRRDTALRERLGRRHDDGRAACAAVQRFQPAALPLAAHRRHGAQLPLAARQNHRLLPRETGEVRRLPLHLALVAAEHEQRAAAAQAERRRELRAVDGRKPRHRHGRLPGFDMVPDFLQLRHLPERAHQPLHGRPSSPRRPGTAPASGGCACLLFSVYAVCSALLHVRLKRFIARSTPCEMSTGTAVTARSSASVSTF